MGKNIIYSLSAALMLTLTSCGNDGCTDATVAYNTGTIISEGNEDYVVKSFYVFAPGSISDTLPQTMASATDKTFQLKLDSRNVSGTDITSGETDFLFFFITQTTDSIVNDEGEKVAVVTNDTIIDNVKFYYENQMFFLNIDCGCTVYHFLDSVNYTDNIIKKIEIVNPEITNEATPNFNLYF